MAEEQKTYNAGDEDQVAKARGEAEIREYLRKSGLRKLMSDVEGRAWMFGLLSTTGFACSSFSHDALTMAFKEGQRQIGLLLVAEINRLNPEFYVKMCLENTMKSSD